MGFGGSAPEVPPAPITRPVSIPATERAAISADIFSYNLSDADFASRFPGLVQTRNEEIQRAYDQATGPLDSTTQNQFATQGLGQALSSFGGGGEGGLGLTQQGGIGRNTAATSIAKSTQGYQDQSRDYFESILAANPERAIGLSGADAANLSIANTGTLSAANQQAEMGRISQQNANQAASQQRTQAEISAGVALTSAAISAAVAAGAIT